jgi:hypothetical protein
MKERDWKGNVVDQFSVLIRPEMRRTHDLLSSSSEIISSYILLLLRYLVVSSVENLELLQEIGVWTMMELVKGVPE